MSRVFHLLRRLVPALLLACAGLVLTPGAADAACKCQAASIAKSARQADVVFLGTLLREQRAGRRVELAFEVGRLYQGDVTARTLDVASPRNDCGLRLVEDESYVVFASDGSSGLVSDRCSGTTRAQERSVDAVERVLGSGERPQPSPSPEPEPQPPTYTRLSQEPPPDFVRSAAPGAALALVGLLGWFLVRRRD